MDHFTYKNHTLHCDDVPVPALAEKYGTPLYVYSKKTLEHHFSRRSRRSIR
jgi:diaminopimelate decarboxylase